MVFTNHVFKHIFMGNISDDPMCIILLSKTLMAFSHLEINSHDLLHYV